MQTPAQKWLYLHLHYVLKRMKNNFPIFSIKTTKTAFLSHFQRLWKTLKSLKTTVYSCFQSSRYFDMFSKPPKWRFFSRFQRFWKAQKRLIFSCSQIFWNVFKNHPNSISFAFSNICKNFKMVKNDLFFRVFWYFEMFSKPP